MPPSQWQLARQRDFSGGETLAKLPEKVGRNQLIRMENCLISPEGLVTESWQLDFPLFENVSGGVVIIPVPGSTMFRVFGASGTDVISFIFDPAALAPYDMADATGYPGYQAVTFDNPVTILGISHGTPFLGKNYCCAATTLYVVGELTAAPESVAFGEKQVNSVSNTEVVITNTSEEVVTLTGIYTTGAGAGRFGYTASMPQTLGVGETYTIGVTFNPNAEEVSAATLNIPNTLGILQIALSGSASAMLAAAPTIKDFGTKHLDTSTTATVTTITNSGGNPITVSALTINGDDAAVFKHTETLPITVADGGTEAISVTFKPTSAKVCNATLDVVTSVGSVTGIALTGIGADLMGASPESILCYGTGEWSQTDASTAIYNTSPTDGLTVTSIYLAIGTYLVILPGGALPVVIPPGGSIPVTVRFTYPYRGYTSSDTLKVVTNWGTIDVPITMTGVS